MPAARLRCDATPDQRPHFLFPRPPSRVRELDSQRLGAGLGSLSFSSPPPARHYATRDMFTYTTNQHRPGRSSNTENCSPPLFLASTEKARARVHRTQTRHRLHRRRVGPNRRSQINLPSTPRKHVLTVRRQEQLDFWNYRTRPSLLTLLRGISNPSAFARLGYEIEGRRASSALQQRLPMGESRRARARVADARQPRIR